MERAGETACPTKARVKFRKRGRAGGFACPIMRRSEIVVAAYFTYTAVLALVLPVRSHIATVTVLLNLCILAGYALLLYAWSLRHSQLLDIIRDWFPLPLTLLAYREMGWFAAPHVSFHLENLFVRWDRVLLREWGLHRAIESSGAVLPAILEIAYTLTYELAPFAVATIYLFRRRERVESFMFPFLLAVLLCYGQFPFWPSEPPRTVFPGEDFPSVVTVFRRFNWSDVGQLRDPYQRLSQRARRRRIQCGVRDDFHTAGTSLGRTAFFWWLPF